MLWHRLLNEKQQNVWLQICPEHKLSSDDSIPEGWYRPSIVTISGKEAPSDYILPKNTECISRQELMSPKECFAEDFAIYTIDPTALKDKFPERFEFYDQLVDPGHKIISSQEVAKADVVEDGKRKTLTDFIPIDLQTTDKRIVLADEFENLLSNFMLTNKVSRQQVRGIISIGDYSSVEPNPKKLDCVVFMLVPNEVVTMIGGNGIGSQNTFVTLCNDEQEYNKFIFDKLKLGENAGKVQKAQRPHKSSLGTLETLPMGYAVADVKPIGALRLDRPLQTHYVLHEHLADKAGKHFDLRIKIGNLAHSWAVPKGLPKKGERRLAILQPAHTVSYMGFKGTIPYGYGKGEVRIADSGLVEVKEWQDKKKVFTVLGGPNAGTYGLINTEKDNWLIVPAKRKMIDEQIKIKDYRMRPKKKMLTSRRFAVQPRYGGPKAMLYIGDKENRILTRTQGKKQLGFVERTDNFPQVRDMNLGASGTVLEGEIYTHSPEISNAVVIANPDKSRIIQNKAGVARFIANDIVAFQGEDTRKLPYKTRLRILRRVVPSLKYIRRAPVEVSHKGQKLQEWNSEGKHGAYVIDLRAPYDDGAGLFMTASKKVGKMERTDDIQKFWGEARIQNVWMPVGVKFPIYEPKKRDPIKDQIDPPKVALKFKNSMWKDPNYVLQPKSDGSRYLMYVGEGENRILSRKTSVHSDVGHVERTDNVPHLRNTKLPIYDSVLDGEIIRRDFNVTRRIMGSSPIVAQKLQLKVGRPLFIVFDAPKMNGKDITNLPYKKRLELIEENLPKDHKYIKVVPTFEGKNKKKVYGKLVRMGYEGVVLKDKRKGYYEKFMTKKKKIHSDEFVVTGFTEGKGKYEGQIGAITIGKYVPSTGEIVPKGKVGTGLDENERSWWTKTKDQHPRKTVIEVSYMELSSNGIPRQPVFMRIRDDKNVEQTT
jgi:ATP-dependent DNA ligase